MSIRPVKYESTATPTMEGAGVKLHRVFGFGDPAMTDPFLMMDDFRNDNPAEYIRGFPWHPHRGIETITYVLAGTVEHGDSLGNSGQLGAGDIQWMTAGSGIMHQEMPKGDFAGRMHGFQLWANLPSSLKMTAPRYQDVKSADIPVVVDDDGEELNIRDMSGKRTLVVFDSGDEVTVQAGDQGIRFLLVSGKPIEEPVAWHGPIVMNSREEIMQAMRELQNGTFIKAAH